ncbi:HupE/UreJ protein [Promicromonospora sp. AC04]|uniref:HupE/UreJ family protein n=1 Tax=Promicromonospora sp. AC04 TaxID=2135723 RepID=UPI000D3524D1|nr:HupE/UreJ family protein [Promicromonospora sp. AC04]PUB32107.1 HupE/UreJ protein [Promicromonospora sp. AC04]
MRRLALAALAILIAGAAPLLAAAPASAHVVPATTIELDVHEDDITAAVTLPTSDLTTASGIKIPEGEIDESTADAIAGYLGDHFHVSSDDDAWNVTIGDIASSETEQWGTGLFPSVTATATLTAADPDQLRSFVLDYDAIIHQVVTADIFVILHSDWAAGEVESARDLGTITLDTASGEVSPLRVDLDDGGLWQGFAGMLTLGVSHIAEGTDHQLFLLTLLLPAPLLAVGRRLRDVAPTGRAVRRITAITVAFTIGHSVTLALGTLGLPVPQQPVEALIAVSILIAAAHAVRPLFPGREPLVAGVFGLVHGMAFSTTLSSLDLSGTQLGLSLLGFNLGIEIMQLVVVLIVLPPLVVLARTRAYTPLRITASAITAVAATGWLLDRIGISNPVGTAADALGAASPWIAVALWVAAIAASLHDGRAQQLVGLRRERVGVDHDEGGDVARAHGEPAAHAR